MREPTLIEKVILQNHPDYDIERYHFSVGDFVQMPCGALLLVKTPAIDWVSCYVCERSLVYRSYGEVTVQMKDMPYYHKGEFTPAKYKLNKSIKWKVGNIVQDIEYGTIAYLYEEVHPQCFYAWVVECSQQYYLHTGIYLPNPYGDYIAIGN